MEQGGDRRSTWRGAGGGAFTIAVGATTLLAIAVLGAALLEITSAREEVRELATQADRSTYLVGDIGRQISRIRGVALEELTERAPSVPASSREIEQANARIDEALEELEPLMTGREVRHWAVFMTRLSNARAALSDATKALEAGATGEAEALLDASGSAIVRLQDQIDLLAELNQAESARLLGAAEDRLRRTVGIITALGVSLLVGLAIIWSWTFRALLDRRRLHGDVAILEESNRELDSFAGRVAHDVRNAIAPLPFAATALARAAEDPARVRELADRVQRTSQRAMQLLEGLLSFARSQSSQNESCALVDEVQLTLADVQARADEHHITLHADLEDALVACDRRLLQVILTNLLDNALKYTAAAERREVSVQTRVEGDDVVLMVTDTGPGISPEAQARLLEPFYRAPGTTQPGMGLGLATVGRIVSAHGGTVHVRSRPGEGSTFTVRLPRGGAALGGRPSPKPPTGPMTSSSASA